MRASVHAFDLFVYVAPSLNPDHHFVLLPAKVHRTVCLSVATSGTGLSIASLKSHIYSNCFMSLLFVCLRCCLYLFKVAALHVGHPVKEGVHLRQAYARIHAALHVELLVLLLEPHVLEYLHHAVHAHIAEMYPVHL